MKVPSRLEEYLSAQEHIGEENKQENIRPRGCLLRKLKEKITLALTVVGVVSPALFAATAE